MVCAKTHALLAATTLAMLLGCTTASFCSKTFEVLEGPGKLFFAGAEIGPGTAFYFKDPLTDITNTTSVGYNVGTCIASDEEGILFCNNDFKIDGYGTISTQGEYHDIKGTVFKMSIVGGTGKYKNARGVVTCTTLQPSAVWSYAFVLYDKPTC